MSEEAYCNISGYRFVRLDYLPILQADLLAGLEPTGALGTLLLAEEGINIALSGSDDAIRQAKAVIEAHPPLTNIWFKESRSTSLPFAKLKVRIRSEIIAFDDGETRPDESPAPNLKPQDLKRWLDEGRSFTLLDTRNNYEVDSGTFAEAQSLGLDTFREFPGVMSRSNLDKTKPVVTFCTGGIRCEKAAPWLLNAGFTEVYQVEGGILNYFEQCGEAHWQGECFVFDDRVEIDTKLQQTGATRCPDCQRATPAGADIPVEHVEESVQYKGLGPHERLCSACKKQRDAMAG